jgi:hypothetical protein
MKALMTTDLFPLEDDSPYYDMVNSDMFVGLKKDIEESLRSTDVRGLHSRCNLCA